MPSGIDRLAVMGHSGGGPHAIACGALLADRVIAVVSTAGLAPFDAEGLDWFAGMAASGVASLRAAAAGRSAKERFEASGVEYDPEFTPADLAVLEGDWSWLGDVVGPAVAAGPGGLIDDDLAYVAPWGCDPADVAAPVLILHGGRDRIVPSAHGEWLARHCPHGRAPAVSRRWPPLDPHLGHRGAGVAPGAGRVARHDPPRTCAAVHDGWQDVRRCRSTTAPCVTNVTRVARPPAGPTCSTTTGRSIQRRPTPTKPPCEDGARPQPSS